MVATASNPIPTSTGVQDGPPAPAPATAPASSSSSTSLPSGYSYTQPASGTAYLTMATAQGPAYMPLGTTPNSGTDTATGRYPTGYTAPAQGAAPATSSTDQAESTYLTDSTPQSDSEIASNVQGLYAGEISSIQNYYNGLLGQQNIINTNNEGKTRATDSAEGELGSDMGNADESNASAAAETASGDIVSQENNAEGSVTNEEASATLSQEASQEQTKLAADVQNIGYQSTKAQTAQSQIQTIAGTTDLASLPQDEYDSLYEAAGFATPEQFNTYYNAARQSALTGGKTIGDASTGVWQQQANGTWTNVIPSGTTIGDPTTGVYAKQSDGSYSQVIAPQNKVGTIGAAGSYIYNPSTGQVQTIAPAAPKIVSSGGVIYSVNPTTGTATQLTANKTGWTATGGSADNEKAGIMSYVNSLGLSSDQAAALQQSIQSNPQAYYTALGNAAQAGYYTPTTIGTGTGADTTDETDAATNDAISQDDSSSAASN